MKKFLLPIMVFMILAMLVTGCVKPGAKLNVTTPEVGTPSQEAAITPQKVDMDNSTTTEPPPIEETEETQELVTPAPEATQEQVATSQVSSEAMSEVEETLDEVNELLDELDSILNESFDD